MADTTELDNLLTELMPPEPNFPVFVWTPVTFDPLNPLQHIPEVTDTEIPDFNESLAEVSFVDSPLWFAPGELGNMPQYEGVTAQPVPPRPTITLPDEPVFWPVNIPDPIPLEIPTFDSTLLDEDLLIPINTFNFVDEPYTSELKTSVYNGLLAEIQNGGYGLNPNDETLLFDRERERESKTALAAVEETKKQFASLGFTLPPGALVAAINKVTQETANKVSSINRDLGLKRADLYWEGKKFTYQQSIQLEQNLMNLFNSMRERSLNAARTQIEVSINIFNAQVSQYKAKQERFVALAEVFKTRIQAELAKVEVYKARMDGAKLELEVNRSQLALYMERVGIRKILMDMYKIDVDAYRVISEVEKLKIDIYRLELEVYVAKVQCKKTEFEAYEASVKGELAKVEVFKSQAQAYASVVDGKKALIESKRLKITAIIEHNKGIIDIFNAQVAEQKSWLDAQKTYIESQAEVYKARVSAFTAETGAYVDIEKIDIQDKEVEYRNTFQTGQLANEEEKTDIQYSEVEYRNTFQTGQLLNEVQKILTQDKEVEYRNQFQTGQLLNEDRKIEIQDKEVEYRNIFQTGQLDNEEIKNAIQNNEVEYRNIFQIGQLKNELVKINMELNKAWIDFDKGIGMAQLNQFNHNFGISDSTTRSTQDSTSQSRTESFQKSEHTSAAQSNSHMHTYKEK